MVVVVIPETPAREKIGLWLGSAAALTLLLLAGLAVKVGYLDSRKTPNPPAVSRRYRNLADRLVQQGKASRAVAAYTQALP